MRPDHGQIRVATQDQKLAKFLAIPGRHDCVFDFPDGVVEFAGNPLQIELLATPFLYLFVPDDTAEDHGAVTLRGSRAEKHLAGAEAMT